MKFDFNIGDQRNTQAMDMQPCTITESVHNELDEIKTGNKGVKLLLVLIGKRFREFIDYPVIVESWDKIKYGRGKREWLKTFTRAERSKLSKYHGRFYRWYLVTGVPERISMKASTLELLQKMTNWFATI